MSVRLSPSARRDLLDIWAYVADDSVRAADRLIAAFDQTFSVVDENPEMGRSRDEIDKGLRSFPLRSYVIFYASTQEGIEVVRVLHARQDVEESFDG